MPLKLTEGTFTVASPSHLKDRFADETFDSGSPDGLLDSIRHGGLIVVMTESGSEARYDITVGGDPPADPPGYDDLGTFWFRVPKGDIPLVLGRDELTQICDAHHGDVSAYKFNSDQHPIARLTPGNYRVHVRGRAVNFREVGAHVALRLHFQPVSRKFTVRYRSQDDLPRI